MKIINNVIRHSVVETIYESQLLPLKIRKLFDSITNINWIYIIPSSGVEYAITEECADDIIKSMSEEKI